MVLLLIIIVFEYVLKIFTKVDYNSIPFIIPLTFYSGYLQNNTRK